MTIANVELRTHQWSHRGLVPLPELAFQHILAAILRGEYVSGDRLDTARFTQELHMSLNPVREAIIRLRDIGLVEVTPARYTKVAEFTAADSCAALSYAGVLAGTALRKALPTTADGVRSELAAYAEEIGGADEAVSRNAAVIGFLTVVTGLIEHPRQAIHLVEAKILVQCALQFSGVTRGDGVAQVRSAAAEAVAHAMRAGDSDAAESAVRALFDHLV